MEKNIENENHPTTMRRIGCEIHHSRDAYENYRSAMTHLRQPVGMHHHTFFEIYLFLSGDLDYQIESRIYHMRAGDLLLISPSEMHQPIFIPAEGFYERIVLWIEPVLLEELSTSQEDLSQCFQNCVMHHNNLIHLSVPQKDHLVFYMNELVDLTKQGSKCSSIQENALVSLIMSLINEASQENRSQQILTVSEYLSPYTVDAVKYIASHLNQSLTVSEIAAVLSVSVQHLLKVFRTDMGITLHQYIVQKRILTARQYILNGMSPSQAAEICGFANYTTFWREYRRVYGVSPGKHPH